MLTPNSVEMSHVSSRIVIFVVRGVATCAKYSKSITHEGPVGLLKVTLEGSSLCRQLSKLWNRASVYRDRESFDSSMRI